MKHDASGMHSFVARYALCALASLGLAACGSGAVSGPQVTVTPSPIAILPATATLYSNLPTTFAVSGGNGTYVVTSSDQATVPVIGAVAGNSFTVVPNSVAADTAVTLIVRDTGTATPVTAALIVKPRTVSNVVTITPSASQPAACGSAVCAGGDAEVKATLFLAGLPLSSRQVRFDVVSGDFRIITSAPGLPEVLALTGTTVTDGAGTARIRIRVLNDAGSQTGLLQITDVSSGASQRTSVNIAPSSNAPLNAQPNTIAFQGVASGTCASGITADVIVFGGRPPYQVSQPGSFDVFPSTVPNSGGRFSVRANGQCSGGSQVAIVDNSGATVSITVSNKLSDVVAPPVTPTVAPFIVSPSGVPLTSCTEVANVSLSGGSGAYFAASGDSSVNAIVSGNIGSIFRKAGPSAPKSVTVQFSDGKSTFPVSVTLSAPGATGVCS